MSETGLPAKDPTYGIVSVLYHALQGAETYQKYSQDAQKAGDPELQQFFDNCQREEHARALQAKSLLMERLEEDDEGESDDDSEEEE
jgi:rubrerythrin